MCVCHRRYVGVIGCVWVVCVRRVNVVEIVVVYVVDGSMVTGGGGDREGEVCQRVDDKEGGVCVCVCV